MSARPPPLARTALLLDFDGTLVEIAPRPDAVVVPPALPGTLRRLAARLDGALAIVTGRPIDALDGFLGGAVGAVAGEHGAALRRAAAAAVERPPLPAPPPEWDAALREWAAAHPGTIVEPKAFGVALHFRARPELADAARALTAGLIEGDARFQLLRGLMLWEIRPAGVDKGGAVRALMAEAPFAGRLPLFVGDDTTDADGIAAAEALGGAGLWVDRAFGSPAAVRAWLARAAEAGEWPNLPGGDA